MQTGPTLRRELGLVQATSLAITDMVGIGPYITIPLLLAAMGGPQAMLAWFVGALASFGRNLARRCPRLEEATTTFGRPMDLGAPGAGFHS